MTDDIPIWRQAVQDKAHPLNQATWLIFAAENISLKLADRQLADKRDAVIPYCTLILDTDALYEETALGKGFAPANAARLLGHWQVTDALPRLLHILRHENGNKPVYMGASEGLIAMGEIALMPILEFAATFDRREDDPELPLTLTGILARVGKGKPEAFAYIQNVFTSILPDDGAYHFVAELLIEWDEAQGRAYLEQCLKQSHFRRHHKMIRRVLEQFKPGELL
jgi:hypothetical protein